MRRFGIVFAVAVLAVMWSPARAAEHGVNVVNNAFQPPTVTVMVGDSVRWTQSGTSPHTVTSRDNQVEAFDSHPQCPGAITMCMKPGDTFVWEFDTPGTVSYYCKVHGDSMTGAVVVQGASTTTAPSPPTTAAPSTTASPTTTSRSATTTTTTTTTVVADTTTTSSTSSTTSTTEPDGLALDDDADDDDDGGVSPLLIGLAILLFLAAGGYALWRFRPSPPGAGPGPGPGAGPGPGPG